MIADGSLYSATQCCYVVEFLGLNSAELAVGRVENFADYIVGLVVYLAITRKRNLETNYISYFKMQFKSMFSRPMSTSDSGRLDVITAAWRVKLDSPLTHCS